MVQRNQWEKQRAQIAQGVDAKHQQYLKDFEKAQGDLKTKALDAVTKRIPGWNDAMWTSIREHTKADGYTEAELASIFDPRHQITLWKAQQYDLNRAAELRHGELPRLEQELARETAKLEAKGKRLLREEVTEHEISEIVARWTGIPVTRLVESEREKLLRLDSLLHERVVGQDEAVRLVSDATKEELRGAIVVCPPSALNDRWSRRLPDPVTAMASGWMRVRQRARQRMVELPLVISDHADWGELTRTIEEVNPAESWITHGREEALLRWCQLHQRRARALALVGYEDEDD